MKDKFKNKNHIYLLLILLILSFSIYIFYQKITSGGKVLGVQDVTFSQGVYELTECNDGIDNDGDGGIDYGGDPDCTSWAGTSEGPIKDVKSPTRVSTVPKQEPNLINKIITINGKLDYSNTSSTIIGTLLFSSIGIAISLGTVLTTKLIYKFFHK